MQFPVSMNKDNIGQKADLYPIDGIQNPIVGPTVTTAANGASPLAFTTYYVGYSWVNGRGETQVSPLTTIVLAAASNIVVTVPAFPTGATSANVYISQVSSILLLQGSTTTTTYTQSVALVAGRSSSLTNETFNWGGSIGLGDGQGNLQTMLGNYQGVLLPSLARTVTTSTPDQINVNGDGVHVVLDATNIAGTAGTAEVDTLTITAAAATAGNVTVTLNGTAVPIAVLAADTTAQVATKVAAGTYTGYTASATGAVVTFTAAAVGVKTAPAYSAGTTGATGTIVVTTIGTAATAAGSVTLAIEAKDPASGKYYQLLTGVAVVTNSTNVYKIFPGVAAVANAIANDMLPRTWRVTVTANNANPATYSVGFMINV